MNKEAIDCTALQSLLKLNCLAPLVADLDFTPSLGILQVGNNPASCKYVAQKVKHASDVGINTKQVIESENSSTDEVIRSLKMLQMTVDAVIVQLPLPKHIDTKEVLDAIDPSKDADCLTTTNQGRLYAGDPLVTPCTPQGIMEILRYIHMDMRGKNVLVIGRSDLVGKPLATMLTQDNATVTLAHSKSDLEQFKNVHFDVIVSAIGKAKFLKGFKADVLIDVGINFDEDGRMCGDFDIDECECNCYTPVPGGVGRTTVSALLENTINLAMARRGLE